MKYNSQKGAIKKRTVGEGFVIIFMATHVMGILWPWIYYANEEEDDDKWGGGVCINIIPQCVFKCPVTSPGNGGEQQVHIPKRVMMMVDWCNN